MLSTNEMLSKQELLWQACVVSDVNKMVGWGIGPSGKESYSCYNCGVLDRHFRANP